MRWKDAIKMNANEINEEIHRLEFILKEINSSDERGGGSSKEDILNRLEDLDFQGRILFRHIQCDDTHKKCKHGG